MGDARKKAAGEEEEEVVIEFETDVVAIVQEIQTISLPKLNVRFVPEADAQTTPSQSLLDAQPSLKLSILVTHCRTVVSPTAKSNCLMI